MDNPVEVRGIRLYKVTDEEIRDYALSAEIKDEELEEVEFIKVHIKSTFGRGSEITIHSFQPFLVNMRDRGGVKYPTVKLARNADGEARGVGFDFKPDKLGTLRAWIPKTKYNINKLINIMADSDFIVIDDIDLKKEINKKAEKIKASKHRYKDAAHKIATIKINKLNAPTILSMKEKFGEVLDGIKEYDETFGEQIKKLSNDLYNEFNTNGKISEEYESLLNTKTK